MSIDFNGTNSYLEFRISGNITGALSMACWFNRDVLGVTSGLVSCASASVDRNLHITIGSTNFLLAQTRNGDSQSATSTATISQNTWHHALAVFPSQSSRTIYLDGGNSNTTTTSSSFQDNMQIMYAGGRRTTGRSSFFNGKIAEFAVWNASLDSNDAISLARGTKAYYVRPQSLLFYNPMIRNNIDYFQTLGTTAGFASVNITVTEHPRRYG